MIVRCLSVLFEISIFIFCVVFGYWLNDKDILEAVIIAPLYILGLVMLFMVGFCAGRIFSD